MDSETLGRCGSRPKTGLAGWIEQQRAYRRALQERWLAAATALEGRGIRTGKELDRALEESFLSLRDLDAEFLRSRTDLPALLRRGAAWDRLIGPTLLPLILLTDAWLAGLVTALRRKAGHATRTLEIVETFVALDEMRRAGQ